MEEAAVEREDYDGESSYDEKMGFSGIGEQAEFCSYHPLVNIMYFLLTIGITMFSMSPYFLAVTFIFSWSYSALLKGPSGLKMNAVVSLSMIVVMVIVNMFFNNNGETVLFYINTNRITEEAIWFGLAGAVMLISVIVWFSCFNVIMTSDKLIYLFGRIAPVLGLTLSMIFRFVPLLKTRFAEISLGQKCMGRGMKGSGFIAKARQLLKEVSILIAWSLEASIESADSMEARGYGLHGRTSFHLFKFSRRDIAALIFMAVTGAPVIYAVTQGVTNMFFYPKIVMPEMTAFTGIAMVCYVLMSAMPIIIDIAGEIKWKQLESEI